MKLPYNQFELYESSVQDPQEEMKFFARVYREIFKKKATHLREDFCSTFKNSLAWVQLNPQNQAFAVDLDQKTLDYGRKDLAKLPIKQQQRVHTYQGDVLTIDTPKVDIISISNFSIGYMKKRIDFVRYMKNNLRHLNKQGMVIFDLLGGQDLSNPQEEKRSFEMPDGKKANYIWEHVDYNPIMHDATFSIHYQFRGKPIFKNVFTYHWRMWTLAEARDVLLEAGFDDVVVYWEEDDQDNEPSGHFSKAKDAEDCPVWIAYAIGIKK